jgi:serine/threonine protein kinase/Tfp pilus assembly protein PilF
VVSQPLIGKTISRFKIVDFLGDGGMGVVYRADDLKLHRPVALKFLPPELTDNLPAKERLIREATALSSLQHKNICVIHDIDETEDGQLFITMEYLEGDTVARIIESGPLSIERAIHIAREVALGLSSAHKRGTVHRDIKPANIMLTKDQTVKILDFGVAEIVGREVRAKVAEVAGTVAYMSPEQAREEQVDHRTDIWSLGVVFYEMVTGKPPFGGEYNHATLYSIVNERHSPPSTVRPDVPPAVEKVIDRCLEKSPDARYQDMETLAGELKKIREGLAHPVQKASKTIAVLPFSDISQEKDNTYFTDGLADEIVAKLSKLRNLKILPLQTVTSYLKMGKTVGQISAELGVQYLLHGSVRKHGTNIRVTTQLITSDEEAVLWAETQEGSIEEVFDIQEDVAKRVARALRLRLTPNEQKSLRRRSTENTEAYQLYLRGRFFWNKRHKENLGTAIRYFEQAIEKDPQFAPAWAGMADSFCLLTEHTVNARKELYIKATAAARKALEYDNHLAEAHASHGLLLMLAQWDWRGAEKELKTAIRLNPNYATAHHWYGELVSRLGRHDDALASLAEAERLDPFSAVIQIDRGMILYYARRYDEAIESARKALELDGDFAVAHRLFTLGYQGKGLHEKALSEQLLWMDSVGKTTDTSASLAQCYAAAGKRKEAEELLRELEGRPVEVGNWCRAIALVHTALGTIDRAFEWLEKAYELKAESLSLLKIDPKLDPLRGDERFDSLLTRVGLK